MVSACDEAPTPTEAGPRAEPAPDAAAAWQGSVRGDAAVEVTRLVARALGNPGLRSRVKNDMRTSPFLEHKLELASYLKGKRGGVLLAKMAQRSDRSKNDVLAPLPVLEPLRLEFYMPYDEHRATWTGGSEVLVASQFDEGEKPAAYTTDGEPCDLTLEELEGTPDRPVLALVPVETDYDSPLPAEEVENSRDRNGEAIGVYRAAGGPAVSADILKPTIDGGGDNDSGSDNPPGLYMHDNYIDDVGEGGLKGDPELEVHLTAPTSAGDENMTDIQCAGQEQLGRFGFNQDGHTFDGPVRVATGEQFDAFEATFGTDKGMDVSLIEDDDTTCAIKMGGDRFEEFVEATAEAVGFSEAIGRDDVDGEQVAREAPAVVRNFVTAAVNLIETADDEVGMIVEGQNVCAPDGESRGWLIQRGTEINGCTEMKVVE